MYLQITTYVLLLLSIIFVWVPNHYNFKYKLWQIFFTLAIIFAFLSKTVNIIGLIVTLSTILCVFLLKKFSRRWQVLLLSLIIFVLGIGLEFHSIPGFNNWLVINKIKITPNALPFTLYFNFDKSIIGLTILGFLANLATVRSIWKNILIQAGYWCLIACIIILPVTFSFHFVKFEPKIPSILGVWVISNLLLTCTAEEAFFRVFVQGSLAKLKYKYSAYGAVIISSLIFAVIHYPGGLKYMILVFMAGIIYGLAYHLTKRIEVSILAHFGLNLVHILLFTYPALQNF